MHLTIFVVILIKYILIIKRFKVIITDKTYFILLEIRYNILQT